MLKLSKSIIACFILSFFYLHTSAQLEDSNDNSKNEDIIIHKKGNVNEKLNIVIDGNNITVNGKPVDEYKGDNVDIIKGGDQGDYLLQQKKFSDQDMALAPRMQQLQQQLENINSNKAFLGVMTMPSDQGAKINDVTKGSAAEKAGLKKDDIITKIGDDKISNPDDLYKAVGKHKPNDNITITYLRDGKQNTTQAALGKSEQMNVYSWNAPGGDFDMHSFGGPRSFNFNFGDKPRLGIQAQDTEDGNGVKVIGIEDDSPSSKAGLQEDDIITQVNGKAINSVDDLQQSIKDIKKGDTVSVTFKRDNQTKTVNIKLPKDLKTIDL